MTQSATRAASWWWSRIPAAAVALVRALAGVAVIGTANAQTSPPPAMPATMSSPMTLADLIAVLETEARAQGVPRAAILKYLDGFVPDPEVAGLAGKQPEHERTVASYVGMLVTPERQELGRARLAENADLLAAIESKYGVDRHILVALWGIESRFGVDMGSRPVVRSLATLAMQDPRRAPFWRTELLNAVKILVRGDITPDRMVGSWAGAVGHTQFMPSTFNRFAVDFDGDGRRDLWSSAADALASAANYIAHSGWQRGDRWGEEVRLPADFDFALSAGNVRHPAAFWTARGVAKADGARVSDSRSDLRLLLPAGAQGPAFLVNRNFTAILRYNPATAYALAVAQLGDRLGGAGPIMTPWPGLRPLSRAEREELQRQLAARGLETGGVDGILGELTRNAIRSYQRDTNLPQDGFPSAELLDKLRAARSPSAKPE